MSLTSTSACRCYASHYFAFLERSGVTFRVQPDRVSEQAFGNQGDERRRFWPALLIGSRSAAHQPSFPFLRGERERKAYPYRAFPSTWSNETWSRLGFPHQRKGYSLSCLHKPVSLSRVLYFPSIDRFPSFIATPSVIGTTLTLHPQKTDSAGK